MTEDEKFQKELASIKPWFPIYHRKGNKIIREWDEHFDDCAGHTGRACWVEWENKKGDRFETMKRIVWNET